MTAVLEPVTAARPDADDPAAATWALVERAQAGDTDAFGQLYQALYPGVYTFVYFRSGRNREVAEDLTHDAFVRALRSIGTVTWQGRNIQAWIVTIARNLVADHYKAARTRLEVGAEDLYDDEVVLTDLTPEGHPEQLAVDHLTNLTLLATLDQLSPEQRDCIVLRFLRDLTVAETAAAMGKNTGAVKALQYRAVRALQRALPAGFEAGQ